MLANDYDIPPGGEFNLESSAAAVSPTMCRRVIASVTSFISIDWPVNWPGLVQVRETLA